MFVCCCHLIVFMTNRLMRELEAVETAQPRDAAELRLQDIPRYSSIFTIAIFSLEPFCLYPAVDSTKRCC